MTDYELYVRVLTETSHETGERPTYTTRSHLQDVLCELRSRAAAERGDELGQETQDSGERDATQALRKRYAA